ncbi:ROK family protein [Clostridium sp.]
MYKLKGIDQETIKSHNQKRIINLLYREKCLTKQEISKRLQISIPTVITNVKEIIEQGFLEEAGVAKSNGGRKPTIVSFLPNSRYSLAVNMIKDEIRIILINLDFEIISEKTLKDLDDFSDIKLIFSKIKAEIQNIIDFNNIPISKILGIGFSVPGTVNSAKLTLISAPNLKLKNINFREFEETFNIPVYIENEANAAANAEAFISFGGIKNNLVFVSITEGIGSGIIIRDDIYRGFNKRAGEFGHMTIVKDGRQCNCGKTGCWEMYASEKALLEECEESSLGEFLIKSQTNENYKKILENYLDYLAEGVKNIILILDPRSIIIGGKIAYYKDLLQKELQSKIFTQNTLYNENECKVMFSNLKQDASIFGAAFLTMEKLFFI